MKSEHNATPYTSATVSDRIDIELLYILNAAKIDGKIHTCEEMEILIKLQYKNKNKSIPSFCYI